MMLYVFVKKSGDVKIIGGESSVTPELQEVFKPWSEAGWEPSTPDEYVAQITKACETTCEQEKSNDAESAVE